MTLSDFLVQNGGAILGIVASLATALAIASRSMAKSRELAAQSAADAQRAVNDSLTTIRTERATLQAKVFEQVQTIADLRIEVAKGESRYDVLKGKIDLLTERIDNMQTKLQLAERNTQDAVKRAEREEIRANQLAAQLADKQAEVIHLEGRIADLEARLAKVEKKQTDDFNAVTTKADTQVLPEVDDDAA